MAISNCPKGWSSSVHREAPGTVFVERKDDVVRPFNLVSNLELKTTANKINAIKKNEADYSFLSKRCFNAPYTF